MIQWWDAKQQGLTKGSEIKISQQRDVLTDDSCVYSLDAHEHEEKATDARALIHLSGEEDRQTKPRK